METTAIPGELDYNQNRSLTKYGIMLFKPVRIICVETYISMPQEKNYYQILQVDPSAEPEIISAAYKRLSIKYHPDTNPANNAHRRMQEINEAYEVLKDPARRAHYDLVYKNQDSGENWQGGNGFEPGNHTSPTGQASTQHAPPTVGPQHILANFIVSLSFPVTYVVLVFLLFRFFRSPNIIVILAVVLIAGFLAYKVSSRIQRYLGLRK